MQTAIVHKRAIIAYALKYGNSITKLTIVRCRFMVPNQNIMRKLILLPLLIAVFQLHAQQYIPFPINNAMWRYVHLFHDNRYPYDHVNDELYYVNGSDTIIKGDTYKKIFRRSRFDTTRQITTSGQIIFPEIKNCVATDPDVYFAAIREHDKQVFVCERWDTVGKLYFDFNLGIGDTLHSECHVFRTVIVAGMDSILIGGVYHKRISYHWPGQTTYTYIIEGMGPAQNFFLNQSGQESYYFHCFTNTDGTYTADTFSCTYVFPYTTPTGISSTTKEKTIRIFPNPATNVLHIDMEHDGIVYLYNATGAKMAEQYLAEGDHSMNIETLQTGMYFITIKDPKTGSLLYHGKVLKE